MFEATRTFRNIECELYYRRISQKRTPPLNKTIFFHIFILLACLACGYVCAQTARQPLKLSARPAPGNRLDKLLRILDEWKTLDTAGR